MLNKYKYSYEKTNYQLNRRGIVIKRWILQIEKEGVHEKGGIMQILKLC